MCQKAAILGFRNGNALRIQTRLDESEWFHVSTRRHTSSWYFAPRGSLICIPSCYDEAGWCSPNEWPCRIAKLWHPLENDNSLLALSDTCSVCSSWFHSWFYSEIVADHNEYCHLNLVLIRMGLDYSHRMTPVNYEFQKLKRPLSIYGDHPPLWAVKVKLQACTATSSGNDRYSPLSRHHTGATKPDVYAIVAKNNSRSSNDKATCVVYFLFQGLGSCMPATKNVQQLHGFPTHVSHKATNRMALPWLSGSWGKFYSADWSACWSPW